MTGRREARDGYERLPLMYRRLPEFYEKDKGYFHGAVPGPDRAAVPRRTKFNLQAFLLKHRGLLVLAMNGILVCAMVLWFVNQRQADPGEFRTGAYRAELKVSPVAGATGRQWRGGLGLFHEVPAAGTGPEVVGGGGSLEQPAVAGSGTGLVRLEWGYRLAAGPDGTPGAFLPLEGAVQLDTLPGPGDMRYFVVEDQLLSRLPAQAVQLAVRIEWDGVSRILWRPLTGRQTNSAQGGQP